MSESHALKPSWLEWARRNRAWLIVALAILFVVFIRVRLRDMPLERDEGEYAYAGQLMLQGVPPYKEAYNMKLPGTYAAYALIMAVFGQTPTGIHLGVMLVNVASILLVFLLGRKLLDELAGVVAAVCFALLSASPSILGLAGHATHFVTLFALMGVLALLRALEVRGPVVRGPVVPLFASGLMFGLAFVMKQHGIFFAVFGVVFLLWTRVNEFFVRRAEILQPWRKKRAVQPRREPAKRESIIRAHQSAAVPVQASAGTAVTAAVPGETVAGNGGASSVPSDVSLNREEGSRGEGGPVVRGPVVPFKPSARAIPETPKPETLPPFPWARTGLELASLVAGIALPYLLTWLLLLLAGVSHEFKFWTITYAAKYASEQSLADGMALLRSIIDSLVSPNLGLWLLAFFGAIMMWWEQRLALEKRILLLLLLLCSIASVTAGFYFRRHYFITLLPVVALLSGVAASRSLHLIQKDRSVEVLFSLPLLVLLAIGLGATILGGAFVWFSPSAEAASREMYHTSLFVAARKAAEYVRADAGPGARIAVIGSEPEIYFYAHRRSATGYIYTYPLMERQSLAPKMQREMTTEIEKANPEYVIWINHPLSWAANEESDKWIFDWWQGYWKSHMDLEQTLNVEDNEQAQGPAPGLQDPGKSGLPGDANASVQINESTYLLVLKHKGG
jgi:4-amino-4-deoxy-L-arabinose transferase-like glycosyltransferase